MLEGDILGQVVEVAEKNDFEEVEEEDLEDVVETKDVSARVWAKC